MTRSAGLTTIALALALTLAGVGAHANSSGSGTCFVNVVTTPHPTFPSSGNGGFEFSAPAAYLPGADVQITLGGPITGFEGYCSTASTARLPGLANGRAFRRTIR